MASGWDIGRDSVFTGAKGAVRPGSEPATERYVVEKTLGRGGMGEVLLVSDRDLRRQVAMKVLHAQGDGEEARLQFVAEAQATSQLEHQGIPPIHDIGRTKDGRIYFTMKVVRGRTLRDLLNDLALQQGDAVKAWTTHRRVTAIERLCETLHFAHERGVAHRDLKPENVMLGDFGEIHVVDWGLARVFGAPEPAPDARTLERAAERVSTAMTESAYETEAGSVKGTLAYMAPEQLTGVVDRRTDVFALGLVLYEVLTLMPAYDPFTAGLLDRIATAEIPPAETRNPQVAVPAALCDVLRRATAREPARRYATAMEMGAALREWLDGTSEQERRHAEAEAFAAKGKDAVAAYGRANEAAARSEAEVEAWESRFQRWQPVAEKEPLFVARDRLADARRDVALAFAQAQMWFDAALAQEETNGAARSALADLWRGRLDDAEAHDERAEAAYALEQVKRFDDGALRAYVAGDGSLALASDPPGAEVTLYRYVERNRVLVPSDARSLGRTPFAPVTLPMGSYLCVLRREGFRDVRYPVHIARNRRWEGSVRLRTDEEIGADFVLVPAGPFAYGEGKQRTTLELPDFAIGVHPVTLREYAEFLGVVEREEGLDRATARAPHMAGKDEPYLLRASDGTWAPRPGMIGAPSAERSRATHGPEWMWTLPAHGISFEDAEAYCAWRTRATGREWRLPTEEEREKASRGVDGRRFPWGDTEDDTLCKCRDSRPEHPQMEPVGTFPTAESVYGMRDAAGNVYDWTCSLFDRRPATRVLRGGSWSLASVNARTTGRVWADDTSRNTNYGFRCARSLRA